MVVPGTSHDERGDVNANDLHVEGSLPKPVTSSSSRGGMATLNRYRTLLEAP